MYVSHIFVFECHYCYIWRNNEIIKEPGVEVEF